MTDLNPARRGPLVLRATLVATLALSSACVPKLKGLEPRDVDIEAMPDSFGTDATPSDLDVLRAEQIFDDPHLVDLIEEALRNNQELEILRQEMNVANAEIIAKRSESIPKLGLGVDAGIEKVGSTTSQGVSDETHGVPEHLGDFRIDLRASWEIDIWKKLKNATKAAKARYIQSIEGRNFMVTGLIGEVTTSYYELVALDRQLEVLDANIDILQDSLRIVELQRQAARVTSLAVQRFEAELLKNQSRRFELLQDLTETENRLNALLGRYPQPIARSTDTFLERPLHDMAAGLPSQLLERRPDIRASELGLEAAQLDVKVARARFFPSLSIDARFGIEAFNPTKLIALPASLLYDMAAQLLAPLLNRGEIKADYFAANARQMQAVVSYEQTVLLAFVDVANQMAAIQNSDHSFELKARQVDQLEAAIDTSTQLFNSARADFLEVLTTRSEALDAEMELVETRLRQVRARIDLYRSLGGGWPGADSNPESLTASTNVEGGH